jgi:hypothetical protein
MRKNDRFQEFIKRLEEAEPVGSGEEAFEMLADTLNCVENELSNIPYFPTQWMNDGRMYPPQVDNKRITANPKVDRYRNRLHNTYIGSNGAIKILAIEGNIVIVDKPGTDKRKVDNL